MAEGSTLEQPKKFSQRCQDSLAVMAIVEEIARADGWNSLDECFAENAAIVDLYISFADAALRAIKRLGGWMQLSN